MTTHPIAHVQKIKGLQIGGAQTNGLCKIPIKEWYELSISKLECWWLMTSASIVYPHWGCIQLTSTWAGTKDKSGQNSIPIAYKRFSILTLCWLRIPGGSLVQRRSMHGVTLLFPHCKTMESSMLDINFRKFETALNINWFHWNFAGFVFTTSRTLWRCVTVTFPKAEKTASLMNTFVHMNYVCG